MSLKLPLKGSCLCGAVQVSVTAPPLLTLACHCRDCQKLSASAYTLTSMVPAENFSHTGDVIQGGRGSHDRVHFYCESCLSFVFSQISGADHRINLRTSVLDQSASLQPFVELMTNEKLPWVEVPAVHRFAEYPRSLEELQSLMEEYAIWLSTH